MGSMMFGAIVSRLFMGRTMVDEAVLVLLFLVRAVGTEWGGVFNRVVAELKECAAVLGMHVNG
jgi:hypothetical protein